MLRGIPIQPRHPTNTIAPSSYTRHKCRSPTRQSLTRTHRKSLPIRAMSIHEPRNPNPLNHRPLDPTRAFYHKTLSHQHQPTEISRNTRQFKVILRGGVVDTLAENGSTVNQSYRGSNMYDPSGISCRQKQKKKKKKKERKRVRVSPSAYNECGVT